jgi:hypothetical protein
LSSDIIWRDGFDCLGENDTDLLSRCDRALGVGGTATTGSTNRLAPRTDYSRWPGGKGIRRSISSGTTNVSNCLYVLESALSQITLSGAIYRRLTPTSNGMCFMFLRQGSTVALKLRIGVDGRLECTINAGTVLAYTDTVLPLNNWIWFSVKIVCHATTGSVRMVLQGLEDKTVGSLNTDPVSTGTYASFGYGNPNTTGEFGSGSTTDGQWWLDDAHVSTDILSERRVATIYPTSDVLAEWTPNAVVLGNYDRVDEETSDGDTTYVSADNQGAKDIYGFGALPEGVGDIDGVTLNIVARKEDAGDTRKVTGVIRDPTDVDSYFADEHTLLTDYSYFSSVMPDPPSGAWTEAKLEKFGMDLTVGETSP